MTLLALLLLPALGAGLMPALATLGPVAGRRAAAWGAGLTTAGVIALLALHAPAVLGTADVSGAVLRARWPWLPALGLDVALRLDALGWLFATLVAGVGLLVVLYAAYYMPREDRLGRFYGLLLAFMAAMLGIVTSGNLLFLVVCWELTSVVSFLLVGYWHEDDEARIGARTALTVTAGGGLALLAGVLLLGRMAGSFDLDAVLAVGHVVRADARYPVALGLVLLGAFTKSAQWPFHFWLPRAMAAPTPASAYLHSATMVKAGVFLLARLHPVLAGTDLWLVLVGGAGMVTLLAGAYAALWQHDLKGLLAYSTISHLGLITMLLGFGTGASVAGALFHVVNHATFKASLFMAAGAVDHEAGTRDMRVLNGLARHMPRTAALAAVAAAAMAGVPLLNGFLSKEIFFAEALAPPHIVPVAGLRWLEPSAALLFGVLSVGYSTRFIMEVFFNADGVPMPRQPHEPPLAMRFSMQALVAVCLVVGIAPALVAPVLTAAAGAALQGPPPKVSLALWHGFTLPLAMTALAFAAGIVVYRRREALYAWHDRVFPRVSGAELFDRAHAAADRAATALTRRVETGSLQRSVAVVVGTALALGLAAAAPALGRAGARPAAPAALALPDAATTAVWGLLVVATVAVVRWHRRRLAAVVAASAVGLFVSLAFVRLSAPDLALTQLLVEVVTVLLLLLALYYLPAEEPRESTPARRARDLALAGGAGAGAAALAWAVMANPTPAPRDAAAYYLEASKPLGGGSNVVNVLLVDFRGLDTLGEVTVLVCAALGAVALLAGVRPLVDAPGRPYAADRYPVVLALLARPILPLALLLAAFLFVRGHDLPGGGFAAGILVAVALILQYMTSGLAWTSRRLRLDGRRWMAAGVLLAVATGLGALAVGRPFLTAFYEYVPLPLVGDVGVGSTLTFDAGVFAAVLGMVLLVLERLGALGRAAARGTSSPEAEAAVEPEGDDEPESGVAGRAGPRADAKAGATGAGVPAGVSG